MKTFHCPELNAAKTGVPTVSHGFLNEPSANSCSAHRTIDEQQPELSEVVVAFDDQNRADNPGFLFHQPRTRPRQIRADDKLGGDLRTVGFMNDIESVIRKVLNPVDANQLTEIAGRKSVSHFEAFRERCHGDEKLARAWPRLE